MRVPSKTPQQMVKFWEAELAKIDEEERQGITVWSRNFIKAKIQIWKEAAEIAEEAERSRQEAREDQKQDP